MVNKTLIGRFGPDFVVPIERGKIREIARASYAAISEHMDDARAVIPATYLASAGANWGYALERPRGSLFEDIGHDLSVPLHAEEAHRFIGPLPRAGDELIARACLESAVTKQGARGGELTFLVMLTEFRDHAGRPVAEARATTVTTSRSPGNESWGSDVPKYRPDYRDRETRDPFAHIERRRSGDLVPGAGPGPISTGALTLYEMVRYQAASVELEPLHYDEAHARNAGYPGMFGLAMLQVGALSSYAGRWLGVENIRAFGARFPNVFWVGDRLTYDGRISRLYPRDGGTMADLELACCRESDGAAVVEAWMTFRVDG